MSAAASFIGPGGADAHTAIRAEIGALTTVTAGDLLYVGQVFRSRIRQRTFEGRDVNGAPFVPYSTKGPYYFYPNRGSASARTLEGRKARATAAAGRHAKTGRIGVRTATGIKFESYAAAKAAHGASTVNLFGMEQHIHMLDTMMVRAGRSEMQAGMEGMDFGSEFSAFEGNQPCSVLNLGFYGPEAERAKGNNEGTSKIPKREFFALNAEDLQLGERAIAQRLMIRAQSGHGPAGGGPSSAPVSVLGDNRDDWISF